MLGDFPQETLGATGAPNPQGVGTAERLPGTIYLRPIADSLYRARNQQLRSEGGRTLEQCLPRGDELLDHVLVDWLLVERGAFQHPDHLGG